VKIKHFQKIILILLLSLLVSCATTSSRQVAASESNVQLGLAYLQRGDLPRAKSKLLLAQTEDPQSAVVYDALGYFFEKTGELKTAESYYLQAIAVAQSKGRAYNNYGVFLYRQKNYRAAEKYFNLAAHDSSYVNAELARRNFELARERV